MVTQAPFQAVCYRVRKGLKGKPQLAMLGSALLLLEPKKADTESIFSLQSQTDSSIITVNSELGVTD